MAKKDIEFRVGVIILLGMIILFGSLYWLQGYKLERNAQLITVRFRDVGTLAAGDKVTVSGVHRGKVNELRLTENGVLVDLLLYKDVVLKSDATITIKNLGLMGDRFIAISPGTDSALFDTSLVTEGFYDAGLPEVMGLMGDMVVELRELVHSFKTTVASDSSLNKFKMTLDNMEKVTATLADYVSKNETKFNQSVDNIHKASRGLKYLVENNSEKVDSSFQRIDRATENLDLFVARLDTLSANVRDFTESLNNPDGTMNLLMNDRRLYDDLRQTADNLDDLIKDIRENPRKYINLKLELF